MSEQDEINLRREQRNWQDKQDSNGFITMVTCAGAIGGFLNFMNNPGPIAAGLMVLAILILLSSCARMMGCAAKVVEVRDSYQPLRSPAQDQAEVIDVEVVGSSSHSERGGYSRYA